MMLTDTQMFVILLAMGVVILLNSSG